MKQFTFFMAVLCTFLFTSCLSLKADGDTVIETVDPVEEVIVTKEPEPAVEAVQEPVVEVIETPAPVLTQEELEYERSTLNVDKSFEEFNKEKNIILQNIDALNKIMSEVNYGAWENFLDTESIIYWSKKQNLTVAASRLPIKGIRLNSLRDYFFHVFLPSHKGYRVDEIRYETDTLIKAVQVADNTDIVFYKFNIVNGEWKLHLPQLSD